MNIEGNASTQLKDIAGNAYTLKERMANGTASIRDMSASLKSLKGSTEDVKSVTAELKAKIAAEKTEMSKLVLENIKAEKGNRTLVKSAKTLAEETKGLTKADVSLKAATGGAEAATGALSATVLATGAAVAAFAAAAAAAVVALAKFAIVGADTVRTTSLLREAAMGGNAAWGEAFGEQIDALAMKVPTSKAKLDEMGKALWKQNVSGKAWVDTMSAVAQASAALGEDSGGAIKEFITAGERMGRMKAIVPRDLLPTGITFPELSGALAESTGKGVELARKQLIAGMVPLGMGAEALRKAVEKKYASINLRQMISMPVIAEKLKESFLKLTAGINLEPLLKGLKSIADFFDTSTVSGNALKEIVTRFGAELVNAFTIAGPIAKEFMLGMLLGALNIENAYLRVRIAINKMIPKSVREELAGFSKDLKLGEYAAYAIAAGIAAVGVAAAIAGTAVLALAAAIALPFAILAGVYKWVTDIGPKIMFGIIDGMLSLLPSLKSTVEKVAGGIKDTFKNALGIHSPSRVFAEFGENTTAGYAQGVESGSSGAQAAVADMVSPAGGGGRGGTAGRGGAPITIHIEINASGANAQAVAAQVSSESVLEQITKAIVDAMQQSGIPVPS
jgi:hypothetical protein